MRYYISILFLFLFACSQREDEADAIFLNGNIYTAEEGDKFVEAVAVKDGVISDIGHTADIEKLKGKLTKVIDLEGRFMMPGFIEGHGHFSSLGNSQMILNFMKSKNWDEIVQSVAQKIKKDPSKKWIIGRGWHQEKWDKPLVHQVNGYPYNDLLNEVSPNHPVILWHASGHGLLANAKAMELAGITNDTPDPIGGEIVRDESDHAIGVFEETAMDIISKPYYEYLESLSSEEQHQQWLKKVELATKECFSKGITSFHDAGASVDEILDYKTLAENGELKIRLYTMLRDSHHIIKEHLSMFPIIDAGNGFFTCRAIKEQIDGALGSYGAWLLKPYDDKSDFVGQNTTSLKEIDELAIMAKEGNMQLCVHAIGDRGNREVLDIYESVIGIDTAHERRWRIEHAQHLHPDDIPRFGYLGVIPAMQAVHCISDAPFVVKRLGEERARQGAYAWRSLIDEGAIVTNGTDAPVEDVNPLVSLYAAVTRKSPGQSEAFFPEQCMTREEALLSYTVNNAFAAFEEDKKGSIKAGKYADFVVLSNDLYRVHEDSIPKTKVLMTVLEGKVVYEAER